MTKRPAAQACRAYVMVGVGPVSVSATGRYLQLSA
jgi:hypothetical protein